MTKRIFALVFVLVFALSFAACIKNGDKTEGPFEGSYKTGFGVFDTEVENGEIFSYNIDGGKITLRVFGNDCKKVYKLL